MDLNRTLACIFCCCLLLGCNGRDAAKASRESVRERSTSASLVFQNEDKVLIDRVAVLNDQCHGGPGDDERTMAACVQRDKLMEQVERRGWCWGPEDAISADKHWIRCTDQRRSSDRQWFGTTINKSDCISTSSPADRIRMIQENGQHAGVTEKPGGVVEVGYDTPRGFEYWTYYPSMQACISSLPQSQAIPRRYE